MHQQQTVFEKFVGKAEIAHDEQYLLFPQCFQLNQITVFPFVYIFDIISLFAVEFEEPKSGISGKGLTINMLGYNTEFFWTSTLQNQSIIRTRQRQSSN